MSKLVFDATGKYALPTARLRDCELQAAEQQSAEHNLRGPET